MANVYMVVDIPDDRLKPFLNYLKQFDDDRPELSMIEVVVHAPELGESYVAAMFGELGLPYSGKVRWAEKAAKMEWRPENS